MGRFGGFLVIQEVLEVLQEVLLVIEKVLLCSLVYSTSLLKGLVAIEEALEVTEDVLCPLGGSTGL